MQLMELDIDQVKSLLFNYLRADYGKVEAEEQVEHCAIEIVDNQIKVTYDNGVEEHLEVGVSLQYNLKQVSVNNFRRRDD